MGGKRKNVTQHTPKIGNGLVLLIRVGKSIHFECVKMTFKNYDKEMQQSQTKSQHHEQERREHINTIQ